MLYRPRAVSLMRRYLFAAGVLGSATIVILYTLVKNEEKPLGPRSRHQPTDGALNKERKKVRLFGEWQRMTDLDDEESAVETQWKTRKNTRSAPDNRLNDWRADDSNSEKTSRRSLMVDRIIALSHEKNANDTKTTRSSGRRRQHHRSDTTSHYVHKDVVDAKSILTAGSLRGGPGKCTVYDVRENIARKSDTADFSKSECIHLSVPPTRVASTSSSVLVCPHPDLVDEHLSKPLRAHGVWEPHVVRVFLAAIGELVSSGNLPKDGGRSPSTAVVGVYDIGANVGQYSMLAAGFYGCRVVSVEPFKPNIYRIHKAIQLNGLAEKVIVVQNAVSNVRDTFELAFVDGNPSGVSLTSQDADRYCDEPGCPAHATTIFLDDLLEVTNFDVAVMKIDIEGYEHRAFVHADQLLTEVRVAYIFMEWVRMRDYHKAEVDTSEDKDLVQRMVDSLITKHEYTAYGLNDLEALKPQYWYGWPHDIVWVHKTATPPRAL